MVGLSSASSKLSESLVYESSAVSVSKESNEGQELLGPAIDAEPTLGLAVDASVCSPRTPRSATEQS